MRPLLIGLGVLLAPAPTPSSAPSGATQIERLTVLAPASPGGGWDQTARAMQHALRAAGIVRTVDVTNSPGAGGAIGLAQFVAQRGDDSALLVGGLMMVSVIQTSRATVSLLQTTPIARLTGEYDVVVVPAASELKSLQDLVDALRADPGSITWAGGSGGGIDQLLVALIARAIQVDPLRMNYVPFSGGGEAAAALAANQFSAGVSGYAELAPYIRSGKLRALAVTSEKRERGVDAPTLKEQGIDVSLVNWRGVFAAPGIDAAQQQRLAAAVDAMVKHEVWQQTLREYHWIDLYLPGDDFVHFVQEQQARAQDWPDPRATTARPSAMAASRAWLWRNRLLLGYAVLGVVVVSALLLARQRASARRREQALCHDLDEARQDALRSDQHARDLLQGLSAQIDRQFQAWGLTSAEQEVARLMLKGLRHKEIAGVRGTSERTVRQQALTIYKKAGLDGRTDLAAYFLEDLLTPSEPQKNPPRGA